MDLMAARRRILMDTGEFIPPGYQTYDFLQAQGDRAIIDTGVPGNNDLLMFNFCFNIDRYITYRGFFTNYSSESANCWRLSESGSNNLLFTTNTKTGSSATFDIGDYRSTKLEIILDKTNLTVKKGGSTYTKSSPTTAGTTNNNTIVINSSRTYSQTRDDVIKWYYFKMFDNGVLIRNYVPVVRKSDSKPGFYDTVNCTFNPSVGSADFTAGND